MLTSTHGILELRKEEEVKGELLLLGVLWLDSHSFLPLVLGFLEEYEESEGKIQ